MDIFEYIDRVKANFDKQPEPRYNMKKYFMGGSVTTPKRGLVDEPGSYAGRPISKEKLKSLNEAAKKYEYDSYKDVPTRKERDKVRAEASRRKKGVLTKEELVSIQGDRVRLKNFNTDPRVQQLRWINDNAKKYKNPLIMIKDFEKRFKVKDYRNAVLFKDAMKTGSEVSRNVAQYIDLSILELGKDPLKTKSATKTFTFRPGVTEDALFKSAIIQKNKSAFKDFASALKNIDSDLTSLRTEGVKGKLTIEETLKLLNKRDYNILNNFGFIKPEKGRAFRPYMSGLFKDSVEFQNLNMNYFSSFKSLITPFTYIEQIISNLGNPKIAKQFGLNALEVKKVQKGWKNVSKGQAQASQWVDNLEAKIGNNKFRKLFGPVIFEHQLAKNFGKNWKFLPRDYLLRGQMGNQAFNNMKLKTYDSPIASLISQYEKASKAGNIKQATKSMGQIENLHREFNRITGNYMQDYTPSFKGGKFEWKSNVRPFSKKILHRYDVAGVGGKELERVTFGMKNLGTASEDIFSKRQISTIKKYTEKQDKLKNLLEKIGCPDLAAGGRVGFQTGTTCLTKGVEAINSGKIAKGAQARNFANFANRAYKLGRGIMKYGVIPEALFVGAEALIRMNMGDTLDEAFLRSTDWLRFGDQTKEAETRALIRTIGPENAQTVLRANDYKQSLTNLNSAKVNAEVDLAQNMEEFSGESDETIRIRNEQRIKNAEANIKEKFQPEYVMDAAVMKEAESQDIRGVNNPIKKFFVKARQNKIDDIEQLMAPEKVKRPAAPMSTMDDYANQFDDEYLEGLRTKYKNPNITKKDILRAYRGDQDFNKGVFQSIFEEGRSNLANRERLFGTQGEFASGGIASGPPPEKGPQSQGLAYLMKNGKR